MKRWSTDSVGDEMQMLGSRGGGAAVARAAAGASAANAGLPGVRSRHRSDSAPRRRTPAPAHDTFGANDHEIPF